MFGRKEAVVIDKDPLERGSELRVVMNDRDRRTVTVVQAGAHAMLVRELFHGIYDLAYDDVMFVYVGEDCYTRVDLRKWAAAC